MPIFTYRCSCGAVKEEYRSIAQRDSVPECHGKMGRIIVSPSMVMGDIDPYISQVDGSVIQGRREHREHLKQHHLIEVGNEVKHLKPYGQYKPKGVKDSVIREVQAAKEAQRNGRKYGNH